MYAIPDEVSGRLADIIAPEAHWTWWTMPMTAFGGLSPKEVWMDDPDAVLRRIDAYSSGTYE